MSPPCIGATITVVLPKKWSGSQTRLRRATVVRHGVWNVHQGYSIAWKSGLYTGEVWESEIDVEWAWGWRPRTKAALLASRALR